MLIQAPSEELGPLAIVMQKEPVQALAAGFGLLAVFVLLATPLCIWVASVDSCERMACEVLIMSRPMSDVSYCEAWFDLFR